MNRFEPRFTGREPVRLGYFRKWSDNSVSLTNLFKVPHRSVSIGPNLFHIHIVCVLSRTCCTLRPLIYFVDRETNVDNQTVQNGDELQNVKIFFPTWKPNGF